MLRFTTRPLAEFTDAPCDLNDVASNDGVLFVRNGVGFAGRGIALRGTSAEVQEAMLDAEFDDSVNLPGSAGAALGWHSFSGDSSELIVPRVVVGKSATGAPWVTFVAGAEHEVADALTVARPTSTAG
ncbi:MAG: hypothetical protein RL643_403, partial [Actinomycetota bacterium]